MSTSVPDGISFSDLEALISDAPTDIVDQVNEHSDECPGCSECDLDTLVTKALDAFEAVSPEPTVAKAAVMSIINRMVAWHSTVAEAHIEEGETESAIGWARDAGKFQACLNILTTISVSDSDPTCTV
jgi:hypothetical protein